MKNRQHLSATESVLVLETENEQLKERVIEKDVLIKELLKKILPFAVADSPTKEE